MKFFKRNIKFITLLALVPFLNSCFDDQLEGINTDPLAATEADPATLLPFVQISLANTRTSELGIRAADIPEYYGQGFSGAAIGSPSPNQVGNTFVNRFESVLGNLEVIRLQSEQAGEANDAVRAVAMIMQQMTFLELTLIFEDIPYSQALNASEFPTPIFDSQEDVLNGIVDALEDAKAVIDNIAVDQVPVNGDLYYGGDVTLWRKFATSLQIRTLMILRNRDTSRDGTLVSLLDEDLIDVNTEIPQVVYVDAPANDNPYRQVIDDFFSGSNFDSETWSPRNTMVDPMNAMNDPRRDIWFTQTTAGEYVGLATRGFPASNTTTSMLSDDNVLRGDLPDIMFTPTEIDLYEAELTLLNVLPGGAAAAQTAFERGVSLNLEQWSAQLGGALSSTDITNFIQNDLPDLTTLSNQEALEAVYFQQWVDGFLRVIEGWTHVRRTGFPVIDTPPGTTLSGYTRRFFYPVAEENANPNTPASKSLDVPHWFEN
ncbi:MAG: SusD/RagB family nutrient-binding outer membrane lipoprotein [Bacteroidota bacterium]